MRWCDTHLHSFRSFVGDPNMTFENIAHRAAQLHIDVAAITDHLMAPQDVALLKQTRDELMRFRQNGSGAALLFGVEVCEVAADGSTLLDAKLAQEMGFELIIGGVHETHMEHGAPLADVAVMQHRHHMMMMENPLIEILVHPWWLDREEFKRLRIVWPTGLSFVPEQLTVELAHASRRTNTYIEISAMSGFCNKDTSEKFRRELLAYYQLLHREGALFAIGSDAHELSEMDSFRETARIVETLGIDQRRMWQPKIRAQAGR